MGSTYKYLRGSDGTGNAVLAHITSPRSIGSTTVIVDSVSKWSPFYIVTTGTLDVNGYMTPASMTEMYAHTNAGQIIIDGFVPGYADNGNTASQVAVIKPTNHFANSLVDQALVSHNDDGTLKDTALDIFYKPTEVMLDFIVPGGAILTGTGYGSTLAWNLTAGVVYISGKRYTVAAAAGVVSASKDTYFDLTAAATPGGVATLTYTGGNSVANNAASPALAANSLRLGIIQSAATITGIAAINQGQEGKLVPLVAGYPLAINDSIGNRIAPRRPYRARIGTFRKTDTITYFTTAYATYMQVIGESYGGDVTVELDLVMNNGGSGATRNWTTQVLCDGVAINPATYNLTTLYSGAEYPTFTARLNFSHTPAAGKHTWAVQFLASANSSSGMNPNSKMTVKEEA